MTAVAVLPRVEVTRYVTPLREGGSLPAVMEASDLGTYVVKFRGAGQGLPVLVAEVITTGIARRLGLPVPDQVIVDLDAGFVAGEPDEEVQALLRASVGTNLGVDFLPGSLDADRAAVARGADPEFAGRVLWLDAFVNNVDRTWRNPNMLWWGGGLWLIDHGATLTFHHQWAGAGAAVNRPYDSRDHVMLGASPDLEAATALAHDRLTSAAFDEILAEVPDEWLQSTANEAPADPLSMRTAYTTWLAERLAAVDIWRPR